jgi:RNA polymerase sigma-70 factor (ECF subfamily)
LNDQTEETPRADTDQKSGREWTAEQLAFYREAVAELSQLVVQAGLPPAQAEDIVQKVVLKFLEHPPPFIPENAPVQAHAWLMTVAQREIADVYRARRRHPLESLDALLVEPSGNRAAETPAPEREKLLEELRTALAQLEKRDPVNYRLLVGHHIEGRSVAELAKAEGLTETAIRNRLYRIRTMLRKRLSPFREEET